MPSLLHPPIDYYASGREHGRNGTEPPWNLFTLDALDARVFLLGYRDGQAAVDAEGYCEFCGTGPDCGVCGRGR